MCDLITIPMDGTFREVPKTFSQLYNLRAEFLGEIMPLCHFLLPKKDIQRFGGLHEEFPFKRKVVSKF